LGDASTLKNIDNAIDRPYKRGGHYFMDYILR
jgi:hypothetical protein